MNAPRFLRALVVCSIALASCRSLTESEPIGSRGLGGPARNQLVPPAPVGPAGQDPMVTIARFEDARMDGDGLLQHLLVQGAEPVRARAATALGRLPFPESGPEVTRALVRALADESSRVRSAAAFALGQRGDAEARGSILARLEAGEADREARAQLVQAGSRLLAVDGTGDEARALRARVLLALEDPDERVRWEGALAPHRWPRDGEGAKEVDEALIATLERGLSMAARARSKREESAGGSAPLVSADTPRVEEARVVGTRGGAGPDVETAWRAAFSLARRKSAAASEVLVAALGASDSRMRMFAATALGGVAPTDSARAALRNALSDDDERVVCEAVRALGAHPDARTAEALEVALAHPSPHVQRLAFEAWGNVKKEDRGQESLTVRALRFESSNVRNAAFVSAAKLEGDLVRPSIELRASDRDPLARAAAAHAARHVSIEFALPLLLRLAKDGDVRVVEAACESLGTVDHGDARRKLLELLASDDNGVRLAAVEALKERPSPSDLAALSRCLDTSRGDIADEIAANVLDHAARIAANAKGTDSVDQAAREQCMRLFARGLAHGNPYVRRRAGELHKKTWPDRPLPLAVPGKSERVHAIPLPGVDYDPIERPRVRIETNRGAMTFELFRGEAPVHVHSFLRRVQDRFYDGTTWHRVVPNFVIQGGDQRGDGNGGSSWRGDALRAEFTPRRFVRGSLGMPRNDDPDSGGSQLFVCHRETPHLDGRYTLFGELVGGFDVLDRIEVGDRILSARLLGPTGSQ